MDAFSQPPVFKFIWTKLFKRWRGSLSLVVLSISFHLGTFNYCWNLFDSKVHKKKQRTTMHKE